MNLYFFLLWLGFGGLALMALMGLGHGSHGGHSAHGHGHAAHHHGLPVSKFGKGSHPGHHLSGTHSQQPGAWIHLLSPRVLFSLMFGFGVFGTILQPLLAKAPLVFALSLLMACVFEGVLVQPIWKFLLNFASRPAQTLDTLALEEGQAATDFDRTGHGLVVIDLDGQTRQILGTLCREERDGGARVRTGDRLLICAVDGARNTCTVSRLSC